ncbi:MAG: 23S rRNA (pseudouridine(1915)-N(3))-methyltransferase RlmH [Calditrichaeota bacterium]|nr:23S rRNA (pseudouridine(1915)-N(3))-methyltransferase RlmH [Calditrichota bacterium]
MIHIHIIWVGKTQEKAINHLVQDYINRLRPYAKIEITEIRDPKLKSIQESQTKERDDITKQITNTDYLVCLDENGKQFSSQEFSTELSNLKNRSVSRFCFVIGGSFGIHPDLLNDADLRLSFSKMTFTHEMIRPFLLEQLYRACMIETGSKYHH